jgi:hypothetical protein
LKFSKLQETPKAAKKCKIHPKKYIQNTQEKHKQKNAHFSRVLEATSGTFPVYKGFTNMGKSTQKVDKGDSVSN